MPVQNKTLIRAHHKKARSKNTIEVIRHDIDMWTDMKHGLFLDKTRWQ